MVDVFIFSLNHFSMKALPPELRSPHGGDAVELYMKQSPAEGLEEYRKASPAALLPGDLGGDLATKTVTKKVGDCYSQLVG